jgi:opacity protein-like surface antigen
MTMLTGRLAHRCVAAIIAILLTVPQATAGEAFDWSGWFVGAYGGYISGEVNSNDPLHEESTGDYDDDGPMAGIWVGYNHKVDNDWVVGFEFMLPLYMEKGTAVDKQYFPDLVTYEASYRYGVLVGAKGGRDFGKALLYAFGAIGLTDVDGKTYNVDLEENYSPGFEQSAAATHFIWQLGGGVDYQISKRINLGARVGAFTGARADHTMPWNEPGPNEFGYNSVMVQVNLGYRL